MFWRVPLAVDQPSYVRFRSWLEKLADDAGGFSAIWFQEVRRHLGTDAAHVHGGLLAPTPGGSAVRERRGPDAQLMPSMARVSARVAGSLPKVSAIWTTRLTRSAFVGVPISG